MKWNYAKSVPPTLYVACSGGVDSVAAAGILSEWRNVTLIHYNHREHAGDSELDQVTALAKQLNLPLLTAQYQGPDIEVNKEAAWRKSRYEWFHTFDAPVVVAHTLDDATEWYMMTCLRGQGQFMEYNNKNVIRPFLLTEKSKLEEYCVANDLSWFQDPSNLDSDFALRNRVRSQLIPAALHCEPGLRNMVKKRLFSKLNLA